MDKYLELYKKNMVLDDMFASKYSDDEQLYEKNCLEFVVEVGELANESKCFKYWSIKKPNRDNLLEEYADCLLMNLYFFNEYKIKDIGFITSDNDEDI